MKSQMAHAYHELLGIPLWRENQRSISNLLQLAQLKSIKNTNIDPVTLYKHRTTDNNFWYFPLV